MSPEFILAVITTLGDNLQVLSLVRLVVAPFVLGLNRLFTWPFQRFGAWQSKKGRARRNPRPHHPKAPHWDAPKSPPKKTRRKRPVASSSKKSAAAPKPTVRGRRGLTPPKRHASRGGKSPGKLQRPRSPRKTPHVKSPPRGRSGSGRQPPRFDSDDKR